MAGEHTSADDLKLLRRLERGEITSNEFDVLWEVSHFAPDETYLTARRNFAGTKVIYGLADGTERTHWAPDWAKQRDQLRAAFKSQEQETLSRTKANRRGGGHV